MIDEQALASVTTFDELYALLPEVGCLGKCHAACTRIDMTDTEHKRITALGYSIPRANHGRKVLWTNGDGSHEEFIWTCPALTMLKTCAVYEARPLICRLAGAIEVLTCDYGCAPEGGLLDTRTALLCMAAALRLDDKRDDARELTEMANSPKWTNWYRSEIARAEMKARLNDRMRNK